MESDKILIGLTVPNHIPSEWWVGYQAAKNVRSSKNINFDVVAVQGAGIARNRNHIIQIAKKTGFNKVLFWDTDVILSNKQARELCESPHPVVSAALPLQGTPNVYVAGDWEKDNPGLEGPSLTSEDKGIIEVQRCGGGALKIDLSVLEGLEEPYFYESAIKGVAISEDHTFCLSCNKAGIPIMVNCDIVAEHSSHPIKAPAEAIAEWQSEPTEGLESITYGALFSPAMAKALEWLNSADLPYSAVSQIDKICRDIGEKAKEVSPTLQKIQQKKGAQREFEAFLKTEWALPIEGKIKVDPSDIGNVSRERLIVLLDKIFDLS